MSQYYRTLAALRIYLGVFWSIYGTSKLNSFWLTTNGQFSDTVKEMIAHTSGPYHAFVANAVLPHTLLFSYLIAFGETLCGVSLVLGLFTRAGAIGGMFLTLNYWLTGAQYSSKWGLISLEAVIFFLSLFILLLPTNSVWSLDSLTGKRRTRPPKVIDEIAP